MTFIDNTSKKSCLYRSNADQYTCHHRYSTACPNSSVSIYHSSHDPHARHFQVNVLFICLSSCFPVICIGHMPVYCVLLISCIWLPIRLSDDQMSDLNAPACCHLSCYSLAAYSMERGCHNYRFNWWMVRGRRPASTLLISYKCHFNFTTLSDLAWPSHHPSLTKRSDSELLPN